MQVSKDGSISFGNNCTNRCLTNNAPFITGFCDKIEDTVVLYKEHNYTIRFYESKLHLMNYLNISFDPTDESTQGNGAVPPLLEISRSTPPAAPRFGFVRTSKWDELEPDSQAGLEEVIDALGDRVTEINLGTL